MRPPDGAVEAPLHPEWREEEQELLRAKRAAAAAPVTEHPDTRDWIALFVVNLVVLALAASAIWLILFRGADGKAPLFNPGKRLLAAGIALLLAAPLLTTLKPFSDTAAGPTWFFVALFLFALGFVLIGASTRPRRSYVKGALLAMVSYLLIGISWTFSLNLATGAIEAGEIWPLIVGRLGSFTLGLLGWPVSAAAWFEVFGLRMN